MNISKANLGHWSTFGVHPKDFDTEKYFGFIYCIENTKTEQFYLGKKQFRTKGKKRSKNYNKEMNWRGYTGSSTKLNHDISELGKENFIFKIVDLYVTKGGLYYAEAYTQMLLGTMTDYLPDGKTPRWYNAQIGPVRFVPKEKPTPKNERFIKSIKRKLHGKNS